ncbi:MAG: hypothetical protein ABI662_11625 [Dermatophilaceae bacterium]
MRTSTRLSVMAGTSLLGIALAVGGASAAAGSLTTADSPGQVLHVSGVELASGQASAPATARPNTTSKVPSVATARPRTAGTCCVAQVPRPAPQTLPTHHTEMPQSGGDHHTTPGSGNGHDMMP